MSQFVVTRQYPSQLAARIIHSAWVEPAFANGLVVACLTLMLTASDAFGTGDLALAHRSSLWALVSLLIVAQVAVLHRAFLVFLKRSAIARFCAAGLALISTTTLMTLQLHGLKFTPLLPKQPDPLLEFFFFVAQPVVAAGCIVLLVQPVWISKFVESLGAVQEGLDGKGQSGAELDQLISENEVLRVCAVDHYLEVHCTAQKVLVRARMQDAVALLQHREGVRVHRSHWVSRQFVKSSFRQGRDLKLRLLDGSVIPVARSRAHSAVLLCQSDC